MKKLLTVLLVASLVLSSLLFAVACDGDSTEPTTTTPPAEGPDEPVEPYEPALGEEGNPETIASDSLLVTLAAGQTYYVAVRNPGSQQVIIEDANAVITYNGATYTAVDGILLLTLTDVSGDGRKTAVLGVSAADGSASSFTVKVEARPGTMGNPYTLESLDDLNVTLPKDTTIYYQWTATENGNFCASRSDSNTNVVLIINNRTTGDMSSDSTVLGIEQGETVLVAVSTLNRREASVTVSFEMVAADPSAEFTYAVSVGTLAYGISDVTVQIYNANNELITTLVTDANGSAVYTGVWMDAYARITLPEGYTLIQNGEEAEPTDRAEFHLHSGSFGKADAIFTLVAPELDEEE